MVEYKDRLAEAMRDAKVSTAELARHLKISYQAVKKVLNGGQFGAENNAEAARRLKVRSDWLVTGKGPKRLDEQVQADDAWPFKNIEREKILALDPEQRARIEGRLEEMLSGMVTAPPKPATVLLSSTKQAKKRKAA